MFPQIFNTTSSPAAARNQAEQRSAKLAAQTEEMAGLRFSILLTAKWESSDTLSGERRAELRAELSILRSLYLNQMDEIAMTFGVQTAIEVKEEIERTVLLPNDMKPPMMTVEWEELYF
jgi:hypothetical protein